MRHLQELYSQYRESGLMILGFNWADDREIALQFMAENGATFPTVLDSSDAAVKIGFGDYHATGVPVNYVIDREGKVVDAWYGYEHGHARALAALKKAGGPLAEAIREKEQAAEDTPSLLRSLFDTIRKALEN